MRRTISMALLPPIHPPKIFPFCVVWTPIPVISWLYPFIGHIGVCTSNGVIFDFAGSYYVQMDDMAFGLPARYWRLDPAKARRVVDPEHPESVRHRDEPWDTALQTSTHIYQTKQYNFLGENCHAYVAHFLNSINYAGWNQWNMVLLAYNMLAHGSFVNISSLVKTYGPPLLLVPLGTYYGGPLFLAAWLLLGLALIVWFVLWTYVLSRMESKAAKARAQEYSRVATTE